MLFDVGVVSQSITMRIFDDAGLPVSGLNAAGLPTMKYIIAGANAPVTMVPTDLASAFAAYTARGVWSHGDGAYRFDLPDAVFAAAGRVMIIGEASGKRVQVDPIQVGAPVNVLRLNGTAQTARDIGANVLLSPGVGAGQVLLASGVVTTGDASAVASIKSKTDNLPANPAAVGSQMDLVDTPNATAIAALVTAIFAGGSIDGKSLQGVLRLIAAAVIGKVAGLPGTSITQRAIDDSKVRLTLTLDANGNITNVVTDDT